MGAATILGLQKLLKLQQPSQNWLPAVSMEVESKHFSWRMTLKVDITGRDVRAFEGAWVNNTASSYHEFKSSGKRNLERRATNDSLEFGSTENVTELGVAKATIKLQIEKSLLRDDIPYLHFADLLVLYLERFVYPNKYDGKVVDNYPSGGRALVERSGLSMTLDWGELVKGERAVQWGDLEQSCDL